MKVKASRWVKGSDVPRYDERTEKYIYRHYREAAGWHKGARVGR
jgi:hypothetical protein